ncbi:type I pantothenate kinase [Liquorilactobacillus satsumensis]|uniref:Pantothenate kinase n=1 Tax=Liquorilactobacillus satsumensis DSM 16230 = JCM 12392 TaxID=1423801 RepID=A0A0R1UUZ8_9LACO|nr:type I pantothenate kinase [Liquorilactobacillus satsumensis]KRL97008.1 pantothenate kinase [Liquorilactobacillus satsumensis DSM 16230 = JCM 12392]MCC7666206.1 pantothenate kinase [Liquorilactobacillus satsumensis]MCP9329109.1 type I pantothenate kinase [Liquorilactobacillus satsumensis]MCP9357773.1 type I pantothenate kinase [Liquorilactobacillus satsumensis]MCP9371461.1 type I pantothenate kinase [Liquorilactobacillus satsumensis]
MYNQINYYKIPRDEWRELYQEHSVPLSAAELGQIRSLNDRISLTDVRDVYAPLVHLLGIHMQARAELFKKQAQFLGIEAHRVPFILGIAGSVAVGKSTTARLLQTLLQGTYPTSKVQLITTDGFLYSNQELKRRNLLQRKGFPESYDMSRLLTFTNDVKNGLPAKAPVYSHKSYDILPGKFDLIDNPDILIVEGINVLQLPSNQQLYVSDFFDFSIYVDATEALIQEWYLERFKLLLETAFRDPTNYYYPYAIGDRNAAIKMAKRVWQTVNRPNLREYILPTRNRADVILHKTKNHLVNELFLRKY